MGDAWPYLASIIAGALTATAAIYGSRRAATTSEAQAEDARLDARDARLWAQLEASLARAEAERDYWHGRWREAMAIAERSLDAADAPPAPAERREDPAS